MTLDSYVYNRVDFQKVPGHKSTEPALNYMFEALKTRDERHKEFDVKNLKTDNEKKQFIESISQELKIRGTALKYQIFEIGRLLCTVKKVLPRGEFTPWVKANFNHSFKTAHNCMKVFKACVGHPENVEYFSPSCLYIMCAPNFPPDLRQALFDNVKGPVDISKKELVETSILWKNGQLSINDDPIQKILKKQEQQTIFEKYRIELQALRTIVHGKFNKIKELARTHNNNPLIKQTDGQEWETEEEKVFQIENDIQEIISRLDIRIRELEQENVTVS